MEEPSHFNELCRYIGCFILQQQVLEATLILYLVTSLRLEKSEATDRVQNAFKSAGKKTFGVLIKDIQKKFPLPSNIEDRLENLKSIRNWIIHNLYRDNETAIYSLKEAEAVFKRIEFATKEIEDVLKDLDTIGDNMMIEHNIDPSKIKEKAKKIQKERESLYCEHNKKKPS